MMLRFLLGLCLVFPLAACAGVPDTGPAAAPQAVPQPDRVGTSAHPTVEPSAPSVGWAPEPTRPTPARPATSAPAAKPAPQGAPQPEQQQQQPTTAGESPAPQAPAAVPAPVQPAPQATFPAPGPASPAAGSLLQTILALSFVLALLAGLAWAMKRFTPRAGGANANIRMVGALSLGARERIVVVEVADQWIVVGASPGRINALATMPRQEGAEPAAAMSGTVPSGFADWLKQTIDKRNAK